MEISLEQLLKSREERAAHQRSLMRTWPDAALVCLTVQLPGAVKRNRDALIIGAAGLSALLDTFGSVLSHVQVRDLETGYEAYLLVRLPSALVKHICCGIEDGHPLGRLMDIDVITPDGPLERGTVGKAPRTCLLCRRNARFCMRNHSHSLDELLQEITARVDAFVNL